MVAEEYRSLLGQRLTDSLERRGYDALTPVQAKVLSPEFCDCDLRITSQTGSGKTVAIGFALRKLVEASSELAPRERRPGALLVVPTRELAKQVHTELSWLFAPFGIRLACLTGGSSYREELRALAANPTIVVGTPGRLVDHLKRGALDASAIHSIVLDEADRMLDLGFAEDLEAIFGAAPNRQRSHLVSATLGPEAQKLAARFQTQPRTLHGTRPGDTHADIEHLVHLVAPARRVDALVNVLLAQPEERTLVFVRTRAEVTSIAQELDDAGFRVATLSGDMEQPARERALLAFRQDKVRVLVATDVAARGIDIQGMTRVIHLEPPTDADSYTHRSGRTGRAGQKGSSILFVAPERQQFARRILEQARIRAKLQPLPDVEALRRVADERTRTSLTSALTSFSSEPRNRRIAEELLSEQDPVELVAMLIARTTHATPEPRHVPELRLRSNPQEHKPRVQTKWAQSKDRTRSDFHRAGRPNAEQRGQRPGPRSLEAPQAREASPRLPVAQSHLAQNYDFKHGKRIRPSDARAVAPTGHDKRMKLNPRPGQPVKARKISAQV